MVGVAVLLSALRLPLGWALFTLALGLAGLGCLGWKVPTREALKERKEERF